MHNYDVYVNDLQYPSENILERLSENTASVSCKIGGCVALLKYKQKLKDIKARCVSSVRSDGIRGRY